MIYDILWEEGNASEMISLAFDIGGTFTDFVLHDEAVLDSYAARRNP